MTAPNTPAETSDQLNKPAKSGKLEVSDLITIGVFAALYFVMVCIATLVSTLFTGGFGSIFLPAITALISGCVYMLLAARLGKFGGITVMGVIIGLFLFISGHFVLSFIASIVFPVAADLIARAGKYKSKALLLVSYVVFSYGLTGPILPLWFMKDAYVASLQARGKDAASIAVIGAADGPTAIFVANTLNSQYLGAIMVAAYSYMALVPIVQPPVIKLLTTQKERRIRMAYQKGSVSQLTKILFPIVVTIIAGLVAPASVALVGFLMFGNLLRECGVLNVLSETAQNVLANLITIVLGLTVAGQMTADKFVRPDTLLILALGLVAFVFDTAGGVLFAKLLNLFLPEGKKLNPMIGAAGISAFPMSGRVVNKMGLEEDSQNFLLMYSISVNVSGQIASVIAGGLILTLMT